MNQFKIRMYVGTRPTEVIVASFSSASALALAKKLYPMARVIAAKKV